MSELRGLPEQNIPDPETSEAARIAQFQETLGRVGTTEVVHIEMDLQGNRAVEQGANQVKAAAYRAEPTFLVDPRYEDVVAPGAQFVPYSTRLGKKSAHGVIFGDLAWEDGRSLPVAVKPHMADSRQSGAKDYAANIAVDRAGFHNLEAVGVIMSAQDHETAYSLTRLDSSITTLDSLPWRYLLDHPEEAGDLATVWGQVARQAALLHATGSSHGDLAARNVAMAADGGVYPIDWETAKISQTVPEDPELKYNLSRPDMGELLESMVRPTRHPFKSGLGLFEGNEWQGFRGAVFDEYVTTRLALAAPEDVRNVQDELTELAHSLQGHLKLIK